jgi:hypothetical protein
VGKSHRSMVFAVERPANFKADQSLASLCLSHLEARATEVRGARSFERGEIKIKASRLWRTAWCAREIFEIEVLSCFQLRQKFIKGLLTRRQSSKFHRFPVLKRALLGSSLEPLKPLPEELRGAKAAEQGPVGGRQLKSREALELNRVSLFLYAKTYVRGALRAGSMCARQCQRVRERERATASARVLS